MEELEPEPSVSWGFVCSQWQSLPFQRQGQDQRCWSKHSLRVSSRLAKFFVSVYTPTTSSTSALEEDHARATGARAHTQYGLWCTLGWSHLATQSPM